MTAPIETGGTTASITPVNLAEIMTMAATVVRRSETYQIQAVFLRIFVVRLTSDDSRDDSSVIQEGITSVGIHSSTFPSASPLTSTHHSSYSSNSPQ